MMNEPFVLPLDACRDQALVGGKAAGLAKLMQLGFRVPPGVCLTTAAYRHALQTAGLNVQVEWEALCCAPEPQRVSLLDEARRRVTLTTLPAEIRNQLDQCLEGMGLDVTTVWAVRSSCSEEDRKEASFGGLYRTVLGVPRSELIYAISHCWASLWTISAWLYRRDVTRGRQKAHQPQMAVVVQPLLDARTAGVMYSCHPLTHDQTQVVVDAVVGLAEPLVNGQVTPDHFVLSMASDRQGIRVIERKIAEKTSSRVATPTGLVDRPVTDRARLLPAVSDEELLALAAEAKRVEQDLGYAVDIEWLFDQQGLWLLQARPIGRPVRRAMLTAEACVWSRANFRETLPEVPSPLALAWLQEYMETNILSHYRDAGIHIPAGLSTVRIVRGRPYINVTLTQALTAQLSADAGEVIELMGGALVPPPSGIGRLPWWRLMRAFSVLGWKIFRAPRLAPAWFARLKELALAQDDATLESLSEQELLNRLLRLNEIVRAGDLTFAFVAAVTQAFMALRLILQRHLVDTWRPLLNAATQGFGTVISAAQIGLLAELADLARRDPVVRDFLLTEPWNHHLYRDRLAGTAFLAGLDQFLEAYGHRAIGESDIRSPRFAEQPGYLLNVIRGHLMAGVARSAGAIQDDQVRGRAAALDQIRKGLGWRVHKWWQFGSWHRYLCRSQALREANRHYLMYYVSGLKRILHHIGKKVAQRGLLETPDDLFFLVPDEIRLLVAEPSGTPSHDWKQVVAGRRIRMEQDRTVMPPDLLTGSRELRPVEEGPSDEGQAAVLKGMPISGGYAEGPVRLIRVQQDYSLVQRGDVLVVPVIDPGMAPLMGLAAALVVEMGGMLSHGAIIAREYGIPAVANVQRAMTFLREGERVVVDAEVGEIRRADTP